MNDNLQTIATNLRRKLGTRELDGFESQVVVVEVPICLGWNKDTATGSITMPNKLFTSAEDAIEFLRASLEHHEGVPLEIVAVGTKGECSAEFDVTPIPDEPELVAVAKRFIVSMDSTSPMVTCGFTGASSITADGKTLLLSADPGAAGVVPTNFFYNVEDNCATIVQVNVQISSNEFDEKKSAFLAEVFSPQGYGQADLFVAAASCKSETRASDGSFCHAPSGVQERVYDIVVSATDSAGLVGSTSCHVVVAPDMPSGKSSVRGIGDNAAMKKLVAKAAAAKKYKVESLSMSVEIAQK
ncbi:expressed unknown protein [Seminavis robusta]|uniref:Uncharacterized protein n=1 Tax=Seminavis robusta TaxID=568900 RepID=A0A9N8DIJ7_9STRA|nr:expressed unknown protein [Seminavis robusta]|eukprot:Sro172_g075860.1 n/a (299) ;mRNA; f:3342-4447